MSPADSGAQATELPSANAAEFSSSLPESTRASAIFLVVESWLVCTDMVRFSTEFGVASIPASASVSTEGDELSLSELLRHLPVGAISGSLASSGEEADSEEHAAEAARRFLPLCPLSGSLIGLACRTFKAMVDSTGEASADSPGTEAAESGAATTEKDNLIDSLHQAKFKILQSHSGLIDGQAFSGTERDTLCLSAWS